MLEKTSANNFLITFLPQVQANVEDAYNWYELQLEGLGEQFLNAADIAISQIATDPKLFQKIYKTVRKHNLKKFPFGVFYSLKRNSITVIAITHLARHPKTWKGRK